VRQAHQQGDGQLPAPGLELGDVRLLHPQLAGEFHLRFARRFPQFPQALPRNHRALCEIW
jgi:hypothetical protein